ncbi:MAG: DNA polymerase III subunit gamma/tau, partial [Streptococcus sp.]|nr:DNA polymerase III subunit gamma/tau [Streptococcus sp.]
MYQALYRKYRSQTFGEMVGQEVVATTLKQAIEQGKISHAYLFSGPRGTGKTSAAKIFAKAMNCPNQVDGEPCNDCYICQAITEGSLEDVIEIDAASNNGVDEIRDIRDKSTYAPSLATYKVYIIDEVHMLSTGAFNALLKTLEEPTENVVF